jgi:hypothetical protein
LSLQIAKSPAVGNRETISKRASEKSIDNVVEADFGPWGALWFNLRPVIQQ